MLELSQYLENYLWPNFPEEGATSAHVLSILAMVNEKFREGVPAWTCFRQSRPVRRVCLGESGSGGGRCRAGRHGLRRFSSEVCLSLTPLQLAFRYAGVSLLSGEWARQSE